ncbi:23S rRNA (adenine2030-N6)-methyltransferase [Massilia sp. MP_M2]|uniref:23S rRNA (adenine(2030)-N(6))-methyltransferase RlmJ n=1 Tax=Massilia sp. MP_M2 TaxID=3071713 RepID=UPI00319D92F1
MLSYRHAFHAGNHADVLKHFIQVQLHHYMNQKDAAYTYIDTHSGAGVYALDSFQSTKTAEFDTGIGPLWTLTDVPAPLKEYLDLIKGMNPSGKMRYYPGSPYVAEQMAREQDRLRLFELHPADCKILADNFRKLDAHKAEQGERSRGRRVMIDRGDGFDSMKALLPPPSRRALVLIDPPYEVKDDYKRVKEALDDALVRFPSGIYAVWYPVLQRMESRQFADRLKRVPAKEWLNVTLTIQTPTPDGTGLHSSGMFILNPPYTLEPILREVLPYLVRVLGKDAGARFTIEKGTQVTGTALGRSASRTDGAAGLPRQPIGNARRASPLSGKGSLRLPGQVMPREGDEPAVPVKPSRTGTGRPTQDAVRPGAAPRTSAPKNAAPRNAAPRAPSRAAPDAAARDGAQATPRPPRAPRTGGDRPATPGAPRTGRTRQGGGRS